MNASTAKTINKTNTSEGTKDPKLNDFEVNWDKVQGLRVSLKVIEALKNLDVPALYLIPANRRKDARKKYLGYGTRKLIVESQVTFGLDTQCDWNEVLRKYPQAWQHYSDDVNNIVTESLTRDEPYVMEDSFGFIHMAAPIKACGEVLGVLRCSGFLSGKMDDLTKAKIEENLTYLGIDVKVMKNIFDNSKYFSSEKVAVVRSLLGMLSDEIGSYLNETHISDEADSNSKSDEHNFHGLITRNNMILDIIRQIKLIGSSDSSVIIYGESGTGKELIAKLIHENSRRSEKPFVTINCAALTETILEAELFGYKKGAFTGAIADKKGLFEAADTGTIFLDEVGEMSLSLQVKILRLIQEGTFMRVGDTETRHVDVKVISATHRDLRQMIELGKFREDLYYRLAVVELTLPPLRDRGDDTTLLATRFLDDFQQKTQKKEMKLSSEVVKVFQEYYWPGNVREMKNEVERIVALNESGSMIKVKDLSKKFFYESYPEGVSNFDEEEEGFIKKLVDDYERNLLSKYLKKHKWNKTKVAKLCGITRQGLNKKILKYKLDRRRI